jgi:hypothetical protein
MRELREKPVEQRITRSSTPCFCGLCGDGGSCSAAGSILTVPMNLLRKLAMLAALGWGIGCDMPAAAAEIVPEKPDFNFHVQPILSDRCYFCHGADAQNRKAGLRLDQREAALAVQKSGAVAIKPGDPEQSELIKRIYSHDPDEIMPVPQAKITLTDGEKEILRRWIAQGAEYERHWAFTAPKLPPIPDLKSSQGDISGPIDALVLDVLKQQGLEFNREAGKERLLRRVSLDLTGLPPTIAELDAFLADASTDGYEKQVDRLLASPAFGERMAQDWLDVARYADTFGYQSDVKVRNWPYRDWVIQAFNSNKPFAEFITEQLAGDLLPNPRQDQLVATAFNRLHRQTNEGGSIEEEFRVEYVKDRVQTFGLAFLGLTLECAQCHDHKYDPISAKDFYSVAAFFANIDESGLYSHFTDAVPTPTLWMEEDSAKTKRTDVEKAISAEEQKMAQWLAGASEKALAWSKQPQANIVDLKPIAHLKLDAKVNGKFPNEVNAEDPGAIADELTLQPGKMGQSAVMSGENNINLAAGGKFTRDDAFSFSFWLKPGETKDRAVIFHRSKAWTDAGSCGYELLLEDGKPSAALIHFWPGNALRVKARDPLPLDQWSHLVWSYDGSSKAAGLKLYLNGNLLVTEVIRDHLTKDINRGGEDRLTIGQRFRDRGFQNGLIDEFAVYDRALTAHEARLAYAGNTDLPLPMGDQLTEVYLHRADADFQQGLQRLKTLRTQRSKLGDNVPELMVMRELAQPKATHLLKRGSYETPGEQVFPDVPSAVMAFPKDLPRNRLGLAKWVTDPANPLPARVIVNRFWQGFWGTGLVVTSEDFGLQGRLPSHPELLDYLAVRFVQSGWNVKALLKEIVMSRTYRQDSTVGAEVRNKDPENKWLSRGPTVRLSAEAVRDQSLVAAGKLDRTIGGASVDPDKTSRRSLYTFWKRTMPDVRMELFDMAKREVCQAKRPITNTPLQALTLLNEPGYLKASREMATLAQQGQTAVDDQIKYLSRTLLSRAPGAQEMEILRNLYAEQLTQFQQGDAAKQFLQACGLPKGAALATSELAALTAVANALMNFDGAILKR